jgi:hypothetical protein
MTPALTDFARAARSGLLMPKSVFVDTTDRVHPIVLKPSRAAGVVSAV